MTRTPDDAIQVVFGVTDSGELLRLLDDLLWQERRLLARLNFRLAAQQALIVAGDLRWLQLSDDEISTAAGELSRHEVRRAAQTEQVLRQLGLPVDSSLLQLATAAPMPWSVMLDDHRAALRALEHDIRDTAARTADLLDARNEDS